MLLPVSCDRSNSITGVWLSIYNTTDVLLSVYKQHIVEMQDHNICKNHWQGLFYQVKPGHMKILRND